MQQVSQNEIGDAIESIWSKPWNFHEELKIMELGFEQNQVRGDLIPKAIIALIRTTILDEYNLPLVTKIIRQALITSEGNLDIFIGTLSANVAFHDRLNYKNAGVILCDLLEDEALKRRTYNYLVQLVSSEDTPTADIINFVIQTSLRKNSIIGVNNHSFSLLNEVIKSGSTDSVFDQLGFIYHHLKNGSFKDLSLYDLGSLWRRIENIISTTPIAEHFFLSQLCSQIIARLIYKNNQHLSELPYPLNNLKGYNHDELTKWIKSELNDIYRKKVAEEYDQASFEYMFYISHQHIQDFENSLFGVQYKNRSN